MTALAAGGGLVARQRFNWGGAGARSQKRPVGSPLLLTILEEFYYYKRKEVITVTKLLN